MNLLVVAEVEELRTESPLLMIQKMMGRKLVGFLLALMELVTVMLFVKGHKQAVN